jgi:hypothetical protein
VSPTALAVSRSECPRGAADSENGLARHHEWWPGNRHTKNCPARAGSRSSRRPVTYTDTTLSDSGTTASTRNWCRALRTSGSTSRPASSAPNAKTHSTHQ